MKKPASLTVAMLGWGLIVSCAARVETDYGRFCAVIDMKIPNIPVTFVRAVEGGYTASNACSTSSYLFRQGGSYDCCWHRGGYAMWNSWPFYARTG